MPSHSTGPRQPLPSGLGRCYGSRGTRMRRPPGSGRGPGLVHAARRWWNLYSFDGVVSNFKMSGDRNSIAIGRGSVVSHLHIQGSGNTVSVGRNCTLRGKFFLKANHCRLVIGDDTTSMDLQLSMHEAGTIEIGRDCMFSGGIRMDNSDMHSIVDLETGRRLNPAKDIHIGDHVWVGARAFVAKGARIGAGSVIGAMSFVHG